MGPNINGIPIDEVYNYVQASQWVYDNYMQGTTTREAELPSGWENITHEFANQANGKIFSSEKTGEYYYSDTDTGYQAAILKKLNGDLVLVSRGSESSSDFKADFDLAFSGNQQLPSAITFYKLIRNNEEYEKSNITHTGHSLGGANANCLAIWASTQRYSDASITFDAPGIKKVVSKSIDGLSGNERFEYITNIDVAGDYWGKVLDHVDSPRYLIRPKMEDCHSLENFKG